MKARFGRAQGNAQRIRDIGHCQVSAEAKGEQRAFLMRHSSQRPQHLVALLR